MSTITITADFAPRDRVYVDGCRELIGIITAVQWRHQERCQLRGFVDFQW